MKKGNSYTIKLLMEQLKIPCSLLEGIFNRKKGYHFGIRSLTPQQVADAPQLWRRCAAGNALAFAVQRSAVSLKDTCTSVPVEAHPVLYFLLVIEPLSVVYRFA